MKRKGNALLISILLTSILVLITVGLSRLISNETMQLAELIRNGKANYLAESGSELGLYLVHTNDAGTEPTNNGEQLQISTEDNQTFSYQIEAQTDQIPVKPEYIYDEVKKGSLPKDELFDTLTLGESVQIAILENSKGLQRFAVEYYLPVEANIQTTADWDVLLWKLFGTNNDGDTESMSEYFPAAYATAAGEIAPSRIKVGKSPEYPARLGSLSYSTDVSKNGFNCGNFFPFSTGQESSDNVLTDSETPEEARCNDSIAKFLDDHTNVYLVLTNAINTTQLQAANINKELIANIKYRVCTPDCILRPGYDGLAPIFTEIIANGTFGKNSKQLTTTVNPEGFLPVFDFSIYRTAN